jgi:hypothetical protein
VESLGDRLILHGLHVNDWLIVGIFGAHAVQG